MMTREEVNKRLKGLRMRCQRLLVSSRRNPEEWRKDIAALDFALSALRPVSREQVEKVWRAYWDHNEVISNKSITGKFLLPSCECSLCGCYVQQEVNFCPHCGAPMTDEAVQMVMERLEELKNEIG